MDSDERIQQDFDLSEVFCESLLVDLKNTYLVFVLLIKMVVVICLCL